MPLIRTDSTFTNSDVLCFAESRIHGIDLNVDYAIEGFLPVIRNDQYHKTPICDLPTAWQYMLETAIKQFLFIAFLRYSLSLSQLQLSKKLIMLGDFNFNIQNDQNTNFLKVLKSIFSRVKLQKTGPTTN